MRMIKSEVQVTYADPQGVFREIHARFADHVKQLRNLHWNPDDRPLRTIDVLNIDIVAQETEKRPLHQILGVTDAPLVSLLFVEADNSDTFKRDIRKQTVEWAKDCTSKRDPTGWIVIHYVGVNKPRSKGVWNRLVTDFEAEHCCQLYFNSSEDAPWSQLIAQLKQQILTAFTARVNLYEAEIRKLESTRDLVGWNFGKLFAMQESLAWSFERVNFVKEALEIYLSLETMAEPSFFEGATKETDSQRPLKSLLVSDREAITSSMLSKTSDTFHFYRHTLSRKLSLLFFRAMAEKRVSASVAGQTILQAVHMVLQELPRLLRLLPSESLAWEFTLSSSKDLVSLLEEIADQNVTSGFGEVLLLQRDAVQSIGQALGYCIPGIFNDISLADVTEDNNKIGPRMEALVAVHPYFKSQETHTDEFLRLTQQAIERFRAVGASRSVERLVAQLILYEHSTNNYQQCWNLLETTPSLLSDRGEEFKRPQAAMLKAAIDCAVYLGLKERALQLSWNLLQLGPSGSLSMSEADSCVALIQQYGDLHATTQPLEKWFKIEIEPYLRGEGEYHLLATVNPLAPNLPFVEIEQAVLVGEVDFESVPTSRRRQIIFMARDIQKLLYHRKTKPTTIKFTTRQFVQGVIRIVSAKFVTKQQQLVTNFYKGKVESTAMSSMNGKEVSEYDEDEDDETGDAPILVAMKPLCSCFYAELKLAPTTSTKKRDIEIVLHSPRTIESAKVQVQATDYSLELMKDKLECSNLRNFTHATATIPALLNPEQTSSQLRVVIEYTNGGYYEFVESIDLSLHVSVQVQEFFRPDKVLSHFLVEPMSETPVVCRSARLSPSSLFEVVTQLPLNDANESYCAFKEAPVSYVFELKKRCLSSKQKQHNSIEMRLNLSHRLAIWECYKILDEEVQQHLTAQGLVDYTLVVQRLIRLLTIDVRSYVTRGEIKVDTAGLQQIVAAAFLYMDPDHAEKIASILYNTLNNSGGRSSVVNFSDLDISLEVPVPDPEIVYVHYVALDLEKQSDHILTVGELTRAKLTIRTVKVQESKDSNREFYFQLDRIADGWSYSGNTRGKFTVDMPEHARMDDSTPLHEFTVSLCLIPNRTGKLLLPNVEVTSTADIPAEVVVSHAATRVLVTPDVNTVAVLF